MVRLNKYLADCGLGSRRKCDQLILEGKIEVNGRIESQLGVKVDEKNDRVKAGGRHVSPVRHYEYLLLNKPKGYVTTVADDWDRKTVLDLVNSRHRIFPVGRLDIDTTGLLILTNDGELAYKLTHPKFKVKKSYQVQLNRSLRAKDKKKLEQGIDLEEGLTSPCSISFPVLTDKKKVVMILHQGWKRQIRRMFEKLDYQVLQLQRVGFGFLKLNGLKIGSYRRLSTKEIERLKKSF